MSEEETKKEKKVIIKLGKEARVAKPTTVSAAPPTPQPKPKPKKDK